MFSVVVFTLCAILMIFGAVDICRLISLHIHKYKEEDNTMLIIPIGPNNDEVEALIRSAASRAMWGYNEYKEVICLDCGMDDETREICERLTIIYSFLTIMNLEDLNKRLISINK